MSVLNLRMPFELKSALASLPGVTADNARDALHGYTRAAFLSSRLGWPRGLAHLVLGVADLLSESADLDEKCAALQWSCIVDLALDEARSGTLHDLDLNPPKLILNRAAAIAGALKDE